MMHARPPSERHHFLIPMLSLMATLPRGQAHTVEVIHDPWCDSYLEGEFCNCDPVVRVREKAVHP